MPLKCIGRSRRRKKRKKEKKERKRCRNEIKYVFTLCSNVKIFSPVILNGHKIQTVKKANQQIRFLNEAISHHNVIQCKIYNRQKQINRLDFQKMLASTMSYGVKYKAQKPKLLKYIIKKANVAFHWQLFFSWLVYTGRIPVTVFKVVQQRFNATSQISMFMSQYANGQN